MPLIVQYMFTKSCALLQTIMGKLYYQIHHRGKEMRKYKLLKALNIGELETKINEFAKEDARLINFIITDTIYAAALELTPPFENL